MLKLFTAFRYFLLYIISLLITFSQIVIYFSRNCSSYIIKYIHLVLPEHISYILVFGKNMHKDLISLLFLQPIKHVKSFLSNENLLDTTISLIPILLIKIGIFLMKFVSFNFSVINFFNVIYFYIWPEFFFYIIFSIFNFLLFFRGKFVASKHPYILHCFLKQ